VNEVIGNNFLIVAGQEELWADAFRYFAAGHNYRYVGPVQPWNDEDSDDLTVSVC
jgi:hypothetical protein